MPVPAKRVVQTVTVPVEAPPERVFPLLCPVREYDWIDGWTCRLVHSGSGVVEEGCVFVTEHPPEGTTIWFTSRHDPVARRVEFVRATPESHVSRMAISVVPRGAAGSALEFAYEFTSLGGRGDAFVAQLEDRRALAERAGRLGHLLDHYLRTGARLRAHAG